ncbi:MAG: HNH endonuclease signature motif containing protein [Candidatus Pacebacteria bacterium]|nr:HNH endonuclease signature motif containing protein [Candidatus Paceibacterota bacterium]
MFSRFRNYFFSNGYKRYKDSGKLVHRAVVKKRLGRSLGEGEVVHHRDGNKRNNRSSNLQVCSRSQHYWIHKRMSNRHGFGGKRRYYDDW